ncbi:MAG: shikimate kinase [Firmicutes bacterium]|nr:shikimate kinase [Bacillota bacterium]
MNITLIGMPACGKSMTGLMMAKKFGYNYIDTDLLIQGRENKRLFEILDEYGPDEFNQIEEEVIASIRTVNTIIATGGSAIYGPRAMKNLSELSTIVYIELTCETIIERLGDFALRGISLQPGETIQDIYDRRVPLYEKYAHITVNTEGLTLDEACDKIMEAVNERAGK